MRPLIVSDKRVIERTGRELLPLHKQIEENANTLGAEDDALMISGVWPPKPLLSHLAGPQSAA